MRTNCTLYLNNHGSRWIHLDENGKHDKIEFKTKSGKSINRRVIYYESFGNFATCLISYKGKKISVFADQELED